MLFKQHNIHLLKLVNAILGSKYNDLVLSIALEMKRVPNGFGITLFMSNKAKRKF